VAANADGSFAIGGLVPGVYGLVVAGPVGRAAVGFELVGGNALSKLNGSAGTFVAMQDGPATTLTIELASPASSSEEELPGDDQVSPLPGGGFAGPMSGAGGGGAGGGGAGGFGELLGLAGLAGAVVALSDDDNGVASPIVGP
jgi:hypothetical protein